MALISPMAEAEAKDKVEQTFGRLRALLEVDSLPEPFLLYGRVPTFLSDFYMNFKKFVYTDGKLDSRTKAMLGLAVSANAGCEFWRDFFSTRLSTMDADEHRQAEVVAVASTNYMYNTFFKFRENSGSELFEGFPVGLRAHTFAGTSLSASEVELINIVISDINACRPCTSGHVSEARNLGLSDEQIHEAIQCGATMLAGIQFLKAVA